MKEPEPNEQRDSAMWQITGMMDLHRMTARKIIELAKTIHPPGKRVKVMLPGEHTATIQEPCISNGFGLPGNLEWSVMLDQAMGVEARRWSAQFHQIHELED